MAWFIIFYHGKSVWLGKIYLKQKVCHEDSAENRMFTAGRTNPQRILFNDNKINTAWVRSIHNSFNQGCAKVLISQEGGHTDVNTMSCYKANEIQKVRKQKTLHRSAWQQFRPLKTFFINNLLRYPSIQPPLCLTTEKHNRAHSSFRHAAAQPRSDSGEAYLLQGVKEEQNSKKERKSDINTNIQQDIPTLKRTTKGKWLLWESSVFRTD